MKSIHFSTDMVKEIITGRKIEHRIPIANVKPGFNAVSHFKRGKLHFGNNPCPYGKTGDILWVKETWSGNYDKFYYKASPEKLPIYFKVAIEEYGFTIEDVEWKSAIKMPFEAARIFLRITDVRVERLQDIEGLEAISEGVGVLFSKFSKEFHYRDYSKSLKSKQAYQFNNVLDSYCSLWNSRYKTPTWKDNPFVWAIDFEVIPQL